MNIKENLHNLHNNIQNYCKESGRNVSDVKLIAVSKRKPIDSIKKALDAGQINFGENNVMEAKNKAEELADKNINWHIIGSVQTNKVKYITNFCHLLHSLDRKALVDKLQSHLEAKNKTINCLIQVNTSEEETKSGIKMSEAIEFAKYISENNRIKIKGLMTIAKNTDNEDVVRQNFRDLKIIFEDIKKLELPNFNMKELSMGMSSDYKIAIEEGATMIRVGSAIFGERNL